MSALAKVNKLINFVDDRKTEDADLSYNALNDRFEVGYWKIRGLGEPARLMLAYRNVTFKNTTYQQADQSGNFSRSAWTDVKPGLGFDFPNLPYLIDKTTGLKVTESRAIYRYLARCLDIGVFIDPEQAREEMLSDIVANTAGAFPGLCYKYSGMKVKGHDCNKEFSTARDDYLANILPGKLAPLEKYMNEHKNKFLGGNQVCAADFQLWQFLDQNLNLEKSALNKFPRLTKFEEAFRNIPTISKFLEEHPAAHYPMNNKSSVFGCDEEHNTRVQRTQAKK